MNTPTRCYPPAPKNRKEASRMSSELWKPIPNIEGYAASTHGRIFNLKRERFCAIRTTNKGYQVVSIRKKGRLVHRLVAAAFYGESSLFVDHFDHNPLNNRLENLSYVTAGENSRRLSNKRYKNNSSGIKGVSKCRQKWRAQVTNSQGKRLRIVFPTIQEAQDFVTSHKTHFLP